MLDFTNKQKRVTKKLENLRKNQQKKAQLFFLAHLHKRTFRWDDHHHLGMNIIPTKNHTLFIIF